MRSAPALILLLLVPACSSETVMMMAPADGGSAGSDAEPPSVAIAPPAEPAPPELDESALVPDPPAPAQPPSFLPCPPGWREEQRGEVVLCEPWPEIGRASCPLDQVHLAGAPGCARIGPACDPNDDWAPGLPANGVLYVKAGAAAGGDGSRQAPFATIAAALTAARGAGTIALAKGSYREEARLTGNLRLAGACVAETSLSSNATNVVALIQLDGASTSIANLTLSSTGRPAVVISGAGAIVENLVITSARQAAIQAYAAAGMIRDVAIHQPGAFGVLIEGQSQIELSRVWIDRANNGTIGVHGRSSLIASDVVLVDPDRGSNGVARGITVDGAATAHFSRSVIEGVADDNVVLEAGSMLELTDTVIRDARPRAVNNLRGFGVVAYQGARAVLSRVRIENVGQTAVNSGENDAVLEATDLWISDLPAEAQQGGSAIFVDEVSRATLARVHVENVADHAVTIRAAGLTASDLTAIGATRAALLMQGPSTLSLERARFEDHRAQAIVQESGDATISDLLVRSSVNGWLHQQGTVTIARARFEQNFGLAISSEGGTAELEHLYVGDTRPVSDEVSAGLFLFPGANARVSRSTFERNTEYGIVGVDAAFTLEDVAVRGGEGTVDQFRSGVAVLQSSSAELSRVLIEDLGLYGLQIDTPFQGAVASLTARDLIIRGTGSDDELEAWALFAGGVYQSTIERILFERNRFKAIETVGTTDVPGGTTAIFRDLIVREMVPARKEFKDYGVVDVAAAGGHIIGMNLQLERAKLEDLMSLGLLVVTGSTLTASDLQILGTRPNGAGYYGRALSIESGSRATIDRAVIDDTYEVALLVGLGARATAENLLISGVSKSPCDRIDRPDCLLYASAAGVASLDDGHATIRRFSISESAIAGVMIGPGSALDLFQGIVFENAIGANIQEPGFEISRLQNDVQYRNNGVPTDAQTLPVPSAPLEL